MVTALQLSPQQWQSYQPWSDTEDGQSSALRSQEFRELIKRAHQFGQRVTKQYGVKRVRLFGSLARQSHFHPDSDIDLAVEGLRGSQYWEVWRMAEEYFPKHNVEVVEIETASKSMKQAIEKYGIDL